MASLPNLTILQDFQVSPPPATVSATSLHLTFSDFHWLVEPPLHYLFFYELPLTKTHFVETIIPKFVNSLSTTFQHFAPYVGNLIVYPNSTKKLPEIRYVEGDYANVTFAECNLDFDDLTGYHPRKADKFYHLIPRLGQLVQQPDYVKIPVFSLQVTFFPNRGFSIGMTAHHSLGDASTQFCFLKAWTSISRHGTDESFLANETLPLYERLVKYPKLDEDFLKHSKVETLFTKEYQLKYLSSPSDKLRATFILTRNVIDQMKEHVCTQFPTLPCVSSFTITCAYIWSCIAKSLNDELELFVIPIDCRTRLNPPVPKNYFGNCLSACFAIAKTELLIGKEGFINAIKLIGENLYKVINDKDGIVKGKESMKDLFSCGIPTSNIGISGSPKLKLYNLDFGWGKPKKVEKISIDYSNAISIDECKESDGDLEIGVCLKATEMQAFATIFKQGLESFI